MPITIHGVDIDTDETLPSAGNVDMQRRFIDLVEKLETIFDAVEDRYGKVGEYTGNLGAGTGSLAFVWPDTVHNDDLIIVLGDINGTIYTVFRGEDFNDLTNGVIGTDLTTSTGVAIYEQGTQTERAKLGRTAGRVALIDPAAAVTGGALYVYIQRR